MEKCNKCGKIIEEPKDGVLGRENETIVDKENNTIKWPVYCKKCAEELNIKGSHDSA